MRFSNVFTKNYRLNEVIIFSTINIIGLVTSLLSKQYSIVGLDYFVEFLFFTFSIFFIMRKNRLYYSKTHVILLFAFVFICVFNLCVTKYMTGVRMATLGLYITILPFMYFIFSYNYVFTKFDIDKYIRYIVCAVFIISIMFYIEGVFFPTSGRILNSTFFGYGFFASICNQALILSLALYSSGRIKYLYYSLFFVLTVILISQIKAVFGMAFIIMCYMVYMSKYKFVGILKTATAICVLLYISFSIPYFQEKFERYSKLYDINDSASGSTARVAMYNTAVEISEDYFPLGTGQGTFGSVPTNMIYSDVFSDYHISNVYGISKNNRYFILDTHWAYILGENGVLGTCVYISLFLFPVFVAYKYKLWKYNKIYMFIIFTSNACISIESFALPLPNRLAFISIYSGISAIIVRWLKNEIASKKKMN